jgi:CheY-like chemotaxis protein
VITILQIGYDRLQLQTRALLLGRLGYRVISALGNGNAFTLATTEQVDLVLIGHSAPAGIRENAASHFKDHFPHVPVVALCSNSLQGALPHADYNGSVEDAEGWLNTVAYAASQSTHL